MPFMKSSLNIYKISYSLFLEQIQLPLLFRADRLSSAVLNLHYFYWYGATHLSPETSFGWEGGGESSSLALVLIRKVVLHLAYGQ
jgi:hypothetical protein